MEARRRPAGLELVVEDTGEGIAPEALEEVFEPFWRGDAARPGDRSGLGLALARIVEALWRRDRRAERARAGRPARDLAPRLGKPEALAYGWIGHLKSISGTRVTVTSPVPWAASTAASEVNR
jgi:signal transduction histidine kinase